MYVKKNSLAEKSSHLSDFYPQLITSEKEAETLLCAHPDRKGPVDRPFEPRPLEGLILEL